jgi:Family of unknown function (DUF6882)
MFLGVIVPTSGAPAETSTDFIKQSLASLELQQAAHNATWGLGKADTWFIDLDVGEISFHFPDGNVARAPLQVVGTYSPKDGIFLWAWHHPSILEPLRAHSRLAKAWGEKHRLAKWTTHKVHCAPGRSVGSSPQLPLVLARRAARIEPLIQMVRLCLCHYTIMNRAAVIEQLKQTHETLAKLLALLEAGQSKQFAAHLYQSRRQHRRTCERPNKGKGYRANRPLKLPHRAELRI